MGTKALAGTRASFNSFINITRPHPGQIERLAAKNIWDLLEGSKFAITHEEEFTIE
jgi:phenylalanine ammonia-lyase